MSALSTDHERSRSGRPPWVRLAALLLGLALLGPLPAYAQSIAFVGAGAQVASDTAGNITPALPAGTAAGDFAILVVAGRPTDTSQPAAPSGWTLRTSALFEVGANDLKIVTYYRALVGADANPVVTLPAAWVSNAAGLSGQIVVWRGVNTTTPFDVADTTATSTAVATWVAPAITTATANAWVVSAVATSDNNDLGLGTAAGFTERLSGTSYDTNVGGDHAVAVADELQSGAGLVGMPTWEQNASDPDRWVGITFALRPVTTPAPTISYSFEEPSWSGAAGEVQDDGSSGLDGRAVGSATTANTTPASTTNPGTCRYGVFDGATGYVEVADNAALDIANALTVTAWVYMRSTPPELHTIVSKDTNYEFHINGSRQVYWWWNDSGGTVRSITTTNQIALNQWHHIAIAYQSGTQRIYIDGVVQGTTGSYTGTLLQNNVPLFIGTDWNFLSRAFDGFIDEVRIVPRYLTQTEIQAIRAETHPCVNAAKFTISHNGFGIHCVAETITVNVVDATANTPLLNYNAQVQLDTQQGFGTWALVSGSGTFSDGTAGDGIATYTWPLGQSQATFTLYYPQGPPSLDVDVFQVSNVGIRDTDAEGALVFSPNGFSVTAAEILNPSAGVTAFAANQTAGSGFDLHITAYGQTPTDATCGIIETYTGNKSLEFWSQYVNPGTGSRNVSVSTPSDTVSAGATEAAATALDVTFVAGKAVVSAKYKDVGRINLQMKDDATVSAELPNGIRGTTGNFVVRPFDFLLGNIADAAGTVSNPQAANAVGSVFLAAGSPFQVTVTARDAEGSTTPNYGLETPAETVRLATQIFEPAAGASPAVGAAVGFGAFSGGAATGTDFTWAEVGIVRLLPGIGDADYLGAGDVTGTLSERVGRFIPSHFVVTLNSPLLTTACNEGAFTYQGQSFGFQTAPVITAMAVAVGGTTTTNYTGSFFKLTNATLAGRSYTSTVGALNTAGVPAAGADPAIGSPSGGVATLTFSGTLAFDKGLLAPFPADIRLAIDVIDADGVAAVGAAPFGNPVTFGVPNGIPFDAGAEIRYGRINLGTAVGSELVDLPVPMRAEYFAGANAGFVVNVADTCTSGTAVAFSSFTEGLGPGETCVRDAGTPGASGAGCVAAAPGPLRFRQPPSGMAGGDFNLRLAAPGPGNQGGVTITATVPAWLRYDWNIGAAGEEDPSGQATFGIFGGESRQIYTREIY